MISIQWKGPVMATKDDATQVSVQYDERAVAVASGEYRVLDSDGALLQGGTLTLALSIASFTLLAASVADSSFGKGYVVELKLTMADGQVVRSYNDMVLAYAILPTPIGASDVAGRHSEVVDLSDPSALDGYIDQAWSDLTTRLYIDGVPFWTHRTPSAYRAPCLYKACELMFLDLSSLMGDSSRYTDLVDRYSALFERELDRLRVSVDSDQDGDIDEVGVSQSNTIILSSGRPRGRRRW